MGHGRTIANNVAILAALVWVMTGPVTRAEELALRDQGDPVPILRAALASTDLYALPRAAEKLAAPTLERVVRGRDRVAAIAAARALPDASDGWSTLSTLAVVARRPDRPLAVAAARAAAAIADDLDPRAIEFRDIPDDILLRALAAWRAVGADPIAWPDVRVDALTVGARLAAAGIGEPGQLGFSINRLTDDEPAVRRAALELLPFSTRMPRAQVAERLRTEPDPEIALVAAQVLCSDLEFGDDPAPILSALGDAGLTRLRELVAEPTRSPIALLAAARCLAADDSADSRTALRQLAERGPRQIRAQIEKLGDRE